MVTRLLYAGTGAKCTPGLTSQLGQRTLLPVVKVSFAGYFFYLIRRVSRSNILNSLLHAGFDFMIISGTAIIAEGEDIHPGSGLAILVYLVCGIAVLVKRHTIEPTTAGPTGTR